MSHLILIVEDEEHSYQLARMALEYLGYRTLRAETGLKAVELATQELPDLILMDLMLPELDGYEAIRRIRQNPRTEKLPVLVFTAKVLAEDRQRAFDAGCNGYLTKPWRMQEIRREVERLLDLLPA